MMEGGAAPEIQRPRSPHWAGFRCVDECFSILLMPCLCMAGTLSCLTATAFLCRAQFEAKKDRPVVAQSISVARVVVHSQEQPPGSRPIVAWIRDPDDPVEADAIDAGCRVRENR